MVECWQFLRDSLQVFVVYAAGGWLVVWWEGFKVGLVARGALGLGGGQVLGRDRKYHPAESACIRSSPWYACLLGAVFRSDQVLASFGFEVLDGNDPHGVRVGHVDLDRYVP